MPPRYNDRLSTVNIYCRLLTESFLQLLETPAWAVVWSLGTAVVGPVQARLFSFALSALPGLVRAVRLDLTQYPLVGAGSVWRQAGRRSRRNRDRDPASGSRHGAPHVWAFKSADLARYGQSAFRGQRGAFRPCAAARCANTGQGTAGRCPGHRTALGSLRPRGARAVGRIPRRRRPGRDADPAGGGRRPTYPLTVGSDRGGCVAGGARVDHGCMGARVVGKRKRSTAAAWRYG